MDRSLPYLKDLDTASSNSNHRRFGRVMCQDIECTLGAVLDVSAGGARIRCRGKAPKAGTTFTLGLQTLDGMVYLSCVVRWARRRGLFKQDVGVEFVDLGTEDRQALTRLARAAAHNEFMR
jgi:hypothetical protein